MFRLLRALIVWVLVLVALAGCGGSASDKAGGQASDAVVLTLAAANNYTSARLDGVEGQLWYLDSTFGERGTTVTGNVNFEPRPNVIFINRHAFDSLSSAERAILVRAAHRGTDQWRSLPAR